MSSRLDVFVAKEHGISRSRAHDLIDKGLVLVNGKPAKASHSVNDTDTVTVTIPPAEPLTIQPENIPLEILYDDADMAVVHKPVGMVTHPALGNYTGTLVNALLFHLKGLSGIGGVERPGIVHRLDKDTDGLLLIAKNDFAHQALSAQIKAREVTRKYIALVQGIMSKDEGTIHLPIGRHPGDRKKMGVNTKRAREASTSFKVQERIKNTNQTRVELTLGTGRTHQIRVHMFHIGHPVVGDPVYARHKGKGQRLCAYYLRFKHPRSGEWLEFTIKPAF